MKTRFDTAENEPPSLEVTLSSSSSVPCSSSVEGTVEWDGQRFDKVTYDELDLPEAMNSEQGLLLHKHGDLVQRFLECDRVHGVVILRTYEDTSPLYQ